MNKKVKTTAAGFKYKPKGKIKCSDTIKEGKYSLTLIVMDSCKDDIDNESFRRNNNSSTFRPLYLNILKEGKEYKIDTDDYSDSNFFTAPSGSEYWSNSFYVDGGIGSKTKKIEFVRKSGKIEVMTKQKSDRNIKEHNAALENRLKKESIMVIEKDPIVQIIYY